MALSAYNSGPNIFYQDLWRWLQLAPGQDGDRIKKFLTRTVLKLDSPPPCFDTIYGDSQASKFYLASFSITSSSSLDYDCYFYFRC